MTTQTIGILRREGERRAVRHVRHYDATPEEVWAALTEPEQVKNWLAETAAVFGAGWHSHLDAIDALLTGSAQAAPEWNSRYEELLPEYQSRAATL